MSLRPPFRDSGLPEGAVRTGDKGSEDRREESPSTLPEAPECPFCEGHETELMNAFGSHASVCTYWCRVCGSPFEMMRWRR